MDIQGSEVDLRRLAQFVAVAEQGGVTAAADMLHLTQQAVSSTMRRLEREVGVALFAREGRRRVLTPAGRRLLAGAGPLWAASRALAADVRRAESATVPTFAVAHTPAITSEKVYLLLEPVRAALPGISVTVHQMYPAALHAALIDGVIDVGVRRGVTTPEDLAASVIAYHPLRVAVRANHPLAQRSELEVSDLATHPLIVWAPPGSSFYTDFLISLCRRAGFEPTVTVNPSQGTPPVTGVADNDCVASPVVPAPEHGSSTSPPAGAPAAMHRAGISGGYIAKCAGALRRWLGRRRPVSVLREHRTWALAVVRLA